MDHRSHRRRSSLPDGTDGQRISRFCRVPSQDRTVAEYLPKEAPLRYRNVQPIHAAYGKGHDRDGPYVDGERLPSPAGIDRAICVIDIAVPEHPPAREAADIRRHGDVD